jgi:hypothetical protein
MSNGHSTEAGQSSKELNANPYQALNDKGRQRVSPFRLFIKRFLKILLTIYLIAVLAYAIVQTRVSESILAYLETIGLIKN